MTINGGSKPPPYRAKVNLWVLQSLRVASGTPPPFTQGRLEMRLSVNVNLYVICCGQQQALSLRYDIEFNLISTVSYYIPVDFTDVR